METAGILRATNRVGVALCVVLLSGCSVFQRGTPNPPEEPLQCGGITTAEAIVGMRGSLMLGARERRCDDLPAIQITHTAELQQQLQSLQGKDRKLMERAIARQRELDTILTAILHDEGVPRDLLALAVIESAFKIDARSPAGAVGMWQFMKATASRYGLRVDYFEDQRKDPVLSTIAAARLLRELFDVYRDWHLVLAAYNAGAGRVSREIAAAGTSNFWELARQGRLSYETRTFVPRVLAAALILRNPKQYGFA